MSSLFDIGESVELAFDAHRRLRVKAPTEFLPLAAWLHTDVQANIGALDGLVTVLQRCRSERRVLVGNGCTVEFAGDGVLLESRYGTWDRCTVPEQAFWQLVRGVRAFLAGNAGQPDLMRPWGYPDAVRLHSEQQDEDTGQWYLTDCTYFPRDWTPEDVRSAADGAWESPELLHDETTGVWSGMWRDLELAGYYDAGTGEVLGYFPVISP